MRTHALLAMMALTLNASAQQADPRKTSAPATPLVYDSAFAGYVPYREPGSPLAGAKPAAEVKADPHAHQRKQEAKPEHQGHQGHENHQDHSNHQNHQERK